MKFATEAVARKEKGKGAARQIRRTGKIPGIMYGQGKSQLLELDPTAIRKILITQRGSTGLITLRIMDGTQEAKSTAVIQDYQVDPITDSLLHVDLLEVDMNKPVRAKVQVHVTGSVPVGVKVDKGVLHQPMRELHIECLPTAIPDQIDVDASELGIGQGIHVREVQAGEGIKILDVVDHGISYGIYFLDPDGHHLEVFYQRNANDAESKTEMARIGTAKADPIDLENVND